MTGTPRLMAHLLYGSGLRVMECVRLRVKDVDLGYLQITLRDGKGGRDRRTMVPEFLVDANMPIISTRTGRVQVELPRCATNSNE